MSGPSIDWTKKGDALFQEIEKYRRARILKNLEALDRLKEGLEVSDIFQHMEFKKLRPRIGSQQDWADIVGVAQATIGNYERNVTYPNKAARKEILRAIGFFREKEAGKLNRKNDYSGKVDAAQAQAALSESILNAAISDFRFDADTQRVLAVPFNSDIEQSEIDAIERDKQNLIDSLARHSAELADALASGANANVSRLIGALRAYGVEAKSSSINPRELLRLGTLVSRASVNEEISFGITDFDRLSLEQFARDQAELMRLYYRAALAKAQQVDAAKIQDNAELPSAQDFLEVADLVESIRNDDGEQVFEQDIPVLLRDLALEIEEVREAEILTADQERRKSLRRQRIVAVKNGSILIGRFLIVSALLLSVDPLVALNTAASIAAVMGVVEQSAPGTVRKYYEKLREFLPFLPKFPTPRD